MNYLAIQKDSVCDGPGVRVSFYVAGCYPNKCKEGNCPGCHNKRAQNFEAGQLYNGLVKYEIIEAIKSPYIKGLTILGGEPYDQNETILIDLIKTIKRTYPEKDIWIYTGYEFADIKNKALSKYVDVAVVGPFIVEQRDISDANRWRGSRNQRVLDMQKSLKTGKPVMLEDIPNNK